MPAAVASVYMACKALMTPGNLHGGKAATDFHPLAEPTLMVALKYSGTECHAFTSIRPPSQRVELLMVTV